MAVELSGFTDLQADLLRLAEAATNGAGVDRALRAGAVPIEAQMKANASSDPKIISGKLHGAISTGGVKKSRNAGKRITIGVHRKDWDGEDDYYPAYVEHGHGGPGPAPPHPYIRPAFDARANEAFGEIRRVLRDEIK